MAAAVIAVLKGFLLDAYRIPSASMVPTLVGSDALGVHERVLVDRLAFRLRAPRRFEVAVFRYPLDRSRTFVKRIVGMPGEELRIAHGDLWVRASAAEPWRVLRRPRGVMEAQWKTLDLGAGDAARRWWPESGGAPFAPGKAWLAGGESALFDRGAPILDLFRDGHSAALAGLEAPRGGSGQRSVGDLCVRARVRAAVDCASLALEIGEAGRSYRFELPGPAAPAEGARLRVRIPADAPDASARDETLEAALPRLRADGWTAVAAWNLDDELVLEVDGREVLRAAVPPAWDPVSTLRIACTGGGAELEELEVARDILYLEGRLHEFALAEDEYLVLGDNTQDSADGRDWLLALVTWPGPGSEGRVVRGEHRPGQNPRPLASAPLFEFRDEWGERHWLPAQGTLRLPPLDAPGVPRGLLVGRALAVLWPLRARGSWRPRFVR